MSEDLTENFGKNLKLAMWIFILIPVIAFGFPIMYMIARDYPYHCIALGALSWGAYFYFKRKKDKKNKQKYYYEWRNQYG